MKNKNIAIITVVCVQFFISGVAESASKALVLSGGGSPAGNHYSQYLQTKTLSRFIQQKLGAKNTSVYFGVGNNQNRPKIYPDVHAEFVKEGKTTHKMLHGKINQNHTATMKNVLHFFQKTASQKITKNDTFFLFVSDHGMPNKSGGHDNNCIDMWSFDEEEMQRGKWNSICLSVNELKKQIKENIKAKRTVFAMSQCFSGGFHRLSVDPDEYYPTANPNICGFTAVTEDLPASGCTAAVEEQNYQGYERYFTEQLTGKNVISGKPMKYSRKLTVKKAHYAAALVDMTVDIPLSTSEYYLQSWYDTFTISSFKPRTKNLSRIKIQKNLRDIIQNRWTDKQLLEASGSMESIVKEKLAYLKKTQKVLSKYNPQSYGVILKDGEKGINRRIQDIQTEMNQMNEVVSRLDKKYWKTRYKHLFKPWMKAIKADQVGIIDENQREIFETQIFMGLEKQLKGKDSTEAVLKNEFIFALADATKNMPDLAHEFSKYASNRTDIMYKWGEELAPQNLKLVVKDLKKWRKESAALTDPIDKLDREYSHLLRITYLRQQIAAAVLLNLTDDQEGMKTVKGLNECEMTRL